MDIAVSPSSINKPVSAPPSKSMFHRLIICAALSDGVSKIKPLADSDDIKATINAVTALGADVKISDGAILITGIGAKKDVTERSTDPITVHCSESGSTLRFMIPIAAALGISASFTGEGRLPVRPMNTYLPVFENKGVEVNYSGILPFEISGKLVSGEYRIAGDVSSQFITGLLFSLPLLDGDSKIILTSELTSAPYIELTLNALKMFGIKVEKTDYGFFVEGGQRYVTCNCVCEGDWSNAAFFLCSGAINFEVTCTGIDINSSQGDKKIVEILKRFGAQCTIKENSVTVSPPKTKLCGISIDAEDIPDIIPIICAVAACAEGETHIYNASRLRIKESDRIAATEHILNSMGVKTHSTQDTLTVYGVGKENIHSARIDAHNDHRIAMTAAILAMCANADTIITGAECVKKSFPDFFLKLSEAGGKCHVINMG